jgi:hypothetical protein
MSTTMVDMVLRFRIEEGIVPLRLLLLRPIQWISPFSLHPTPGQPFVLVAALAQHGSSLLVLPNFQPVPLVESKRSAHAGQVRGGQ